MLILAIMAPAIQAVIYFWCAHIVFWHFHRMPNGGRFQFFTAELILLTVQLGCLSVFLDRANAVSEQFATSRMPGKLEPPYLLAVAVLMAIGPIGWWYAGVRFLCRAFVFKQWARLLVLIFCGFIGLYLDFITVGAFMFASVAKSDQSQYEFPAMGLLTLGGVLLVAAHFAGKLAVQHATEPQLNINEIEDAAS